MARRSACAPPVRGVLGAHLLDVATNFAVVEAHRRERRRVHVDARRGQRPVVRDAVHVTRFEDDAGTERAVQAAGGPVGRDGALGQDPVDDAERADRRRRGRADRARRRAASGSPTRRTRRSRRAARSAARSVPPRPRPDHGTVTPARPLATAHSQPASVSSVSWDGWRARLAAAGPFAAGSVDRGAVEGGGWIVGYGFEEHVDGHGGASGRSAGERVGRRGPVGSRDGAAGSARSDRVAGPLSWRVDSSRRTRARVDSPHWSFITPASAGGVSGRLSSGASGTPATIPAKADRKSRDLRRVARRRLTIVVPGRSSAIRRVRSE